MIRKEELSQTVDSLRAMTGFGMAVLAKAIGGLLVVKLCASLLGPYVFGRMGQLMTLVAIISMFAGGGTSNALIQALSSTTDVATRRRKLGAATKIFAYSSVAISIALSICCIPLAKWLLGDKSLYWVVLVLACSHWLVGVNNILSAIWGAVRKAKIVAYVNIAGTLLGVAVFSALLLLFDMQGAALGLVLMPAMTGVVSILLWNFREKDDWAIPDWCTQWQDYRELLSYSAVMLVSTVALPTAQMLSRDLISSYAGWDAVGFWQGTLKISDVYMQFVGMICIYYALPRFSAQKTVEGINREFSRIFLTLCGAMLIGFMFLYALRDWVVHMLFSSDFAPMRDYFLPYMVGDSFRILSMLCVYYALSRGARKILIAYELTVASTLLLGCHLLVATFGGLAPAYAHVLSSVTSCLLIATTCWINRKKWLSSSNALTAVEEQKIIARDSAI